MAHGLEIHHKRDFHPWRWITSLVVLALLVFGVWSVFQYFNEGTLPAGIKVSALQANPAVDESDVSQQQVDDYTVPADQPRYISIPALGISNTRVYSVGVDRSNILISPNNINDTAWYNKSAKPGQGYGAVLINGHNGGIRKDGIFSKLNTLSDGDEIRLERGDGEAFTYRVKETESMSLEKVNTTGMKMMMKSAEEGVEGLNLITCDGKWVPKYQQFDRRIMLRAVLEN